MTSNIKPKFFYGISNLLLFVGIVLLVMTMLVGSSINGSSRWLSLGGLSFQPSEIAKIALVIFVAKQLTAHHKNPDDAFWPIMMATSVVAGIIVFENLSTCLLIVSTVAVMMFLGRVSAFKLVVTGLVAVAGIVLVIAFAPQLTNVFPRAMTWRGRVERFVNGDNEEMSAKDKAKNYQAEQALAAVSTGGLVGKGPGNSYVKNFLPMAFSDFIFSIILEEYGLLGGLVVVALYITILARSRIVAVRSDNTFHVYTIMGLGVMISIQACINMMVGVGLIPVTGQTLPMVSMGGTSNVIMGFAFGVMLSISSEMKPAGAVTKKTNNEKTSEE